ncbi:MAG: beta-N-acetylhexosaminidase [Alphaproteobacteria bacterium]|nr:beta-N-acetylhexosaminidase [Alphaproteobacteria bacterium]
MSLDNDCLAAIFSLSGPVLTDREKSFFKDSNPFGFILFGRNCKDPAQIKKLNAELKELMGRDCPILIDQEGGRVQRLKPPLWRAYPPMRQFGEMAESDMDHALDALRFTILQIAEELKDAGFNVNCAPVLDVLTPETHEAIGDRAFSSDPAIVSRLGLSVCRNLLAAGITPVIKHIPGHGRAKLDSHHALPVLDVRREDLEKSDFRPFKEIAASDVAPAVWGMAAHIVFKGIDNDRPATISAPVIQDIIRSHMGFEGLLLTDDLDMKALDAFGDPARRAELALEAGCDVALYCSGNLKDMEKIAESVPKLGARALKCLQKAEEFRKLAA